LIYQLVGIRYVAELESINTSLQTELTSREAEMTGLENTSRQSKELQRAFESLREQMRSTKAKMQVSFHLSRFGLVSPQSYTLVPLLTDAP
jgi:Tfp pilus assembly protein PilO